MTVETKKQEEILFLKYKLLNFAAGVFFLSKWHVHIRVPNVLDDAPRSEKSNLKIK